mmetsp:Transcript_8415/g.16756  ORF Transcript_8415/g.16756 Transcript_8415/m.16756 type:complete len:281 (+) Transcript_8415:1911-2753(+)
MNPLVQNASFESIGPSAVLWTFIQHILMQSGSPTQSLDLTWSGLELILNNQLFDDYFIKVQPFLKNALKLGLLTKESVILLSRWLLKDPEAFDDDTYTAIVDFFLKEQDVKRAFRSFTKLQPGNLDREHAHYYETAISVYKAKGKTDQANSLLEHLVSNLETFNRRDSEGPLAETWLYIADHLRDNGDFDRARAYYLKVVDPNSSSIPKHVQAGQYELGNLCLKQQAFELAENRFLTALAYSWFTSNYSGYSLKAASALASLYEERGEQAKAEHFKALIS